MKGLKTIHEVEAEEQALNSELTGIEKAIKTLQDREHDVRSELQHVAIQKLRIAGLVQ